MYIFHFKFMEAKEVVGGAIAAGSKVEISTLDNDSCDKAQLILERLGPCPKFITISHQDRVRNGSHTSS
jgi:hypothetical protein